MLYKRNMSDRMCQSLIAMDRNASNYACLHMPKNISMVGHMRVGKRERRDKEMRRSQKERDTEREEGRERLQEEENKGTREK